MNNRLLKIISEKEFKKIINLNILIVGVGGVGGYALESLVRTGVTNITIIDNDIIEESNLNRQIISLNSTLNKDKVLVAKERCLDINSKCNITTYKTFLDKDTIHNINYKSFDYIIDACDTITTKVLLIKEALNNHIKIISCMGTGNRFDPSKLKITKLSKTYNDPLAKIMRKLLKEEKIKDALVCWSNELPIKTKDRTPGSTIFVPATAGLLISSFIIQEIIKDA